MQSGDVRLPGSGESGSENNENGRSIRPPDVRRADHGQQVKGEKVNVKPTGKGESEKKKKDEDQDNGKKSKNLEAGGALKITSPPDYKQSSSSRWGSPSSTKTSTNGSRSYRANSTASAVRQSAASTPSTGSYSPSKLWLPCMRQPQSSSASGRGGHRHNISLCCPISKLIRALLCW